MITPQVLNAAMEIDDPREAVGFLKAMVAHQGGDEAAERRVKASIGYWAGYFSHETRQRVERLFACEHPYLGPAGDKPMSPEEILAIGVRMGESLKRQG